MSIAMSLSIALAVFIGVVGSVLALMMWPPDENKTTLGLLLGIAALAMCALSII